MGATTRSVQLCGWFLELASRLVCGQEGMVLPAHEQGLSDCRRLCVDCVRITSWKRVPARVRVPFVTCSPQCMVCFPRGLHLHPCWLYISRSQFEAKGHDFHSELTPVHSPLLRHDVRLANPLNLS